MVLPTSNPKVETVEQFDANGCPIYTIKISALLSELTVGKTRDKEKAKIYTEALQCVLGDIQEE